MAKGQHKRAAIVRRRLPPPHERALVRDFEARRALPFQACVLVSPAPAAGDASVRVMEMHCVSLVGRAMVRHAAPTARGHGKPFHHAYIWPGAPAGDSQPNAVAAAIARHMACFVEQEFKGSVVFTGPGRLALYPHEVQAIQEWATLK